MTPAGESNESTMENANLPESPQSAVQQAATLGEPEMWAMVEASPDGMLLTDEHGIILVVNSQVENLFGFDRGHLIGQPVETLLPDRHRKVHSAHRIRYRAEPNVRAMGSGLDLLARRSDGVEFPVEVSLSPVTGSGGLRVVATIRDITDRVATEAHMNAVLHTIDEAQDGVFMFTPETLRFVYVNNGSVAQLGYSHDELLKMTPLHIKPDFTEATFRELLEPVLQGQVSSQVFTTVHRRKDGSDYPVEIIVQFPPATKNNEARMMVALVRDITDRVRAEQAIQAQRARLEVLEDRERLAQDLHDLVIQRLFAAGMSLQAVQPLATNPQVNERISQTVSQIDEGIAELRSTIFKLHAQASSSVAADLADTIDLAEPWLGFRPEVKIDGDPESIRGAVVEQLLPTLTEALSNIARHANATSASVNLSVADTTVELVVIDDGDGYRNTGPHGNGLANLRERANRVEGTMSIIADAAGGTTLRWTASNRAIPEP